MQRIKNHIITLLTLLMLLILGGFSSEAWAGTWWARINASADPLTTGGNVYVGTNSGCNANNATSNTDYGDNSGSKNWQYSGDVNFWLCAKPNAGYTFKGWNTDQSNAVLSGSTAVPFKVTVNGTSKNIVGQIQSVYSYYAIFARLTTDKSSLNFGTISVGSWSSKQQVKVTYVHAGDVTATLSGDFSFSNSSLSQSKTIASNNTNTESETTIDIYFKPSCKSTRSGTLTIKGSNGMNDVTISLSGTGDPYSQSLSWDNESLIELNMLNGSTQNISATATSGLTASYSSSNNNILAVDANGKLTAKAVGGPVTITASQDGDCTYSAASSISKQFYVKSKDTPIFYPNGFTHESTNAIYVGDVLTLEVAYVSDGLNGDFAATYDANYFSVTRSDNTITIEALNAGNGKTVVFTQNDITTIYGATKTYTFNISKITNTLTRTVATHEMFVGDELEGIINSSVAVRNRNNTDIAVTVTSDDPDLIRYVAGEDKVIVPNDANEMFGASKVVNLVFSQAETYKYTSASETIAVTVKKYITTIATPTNYNKEVDATPFEVANYNPQKVTKAQPDSGATGHNFYYTIEHTFPENKNVNGSTHPDEVIGYNPANHKISAYNAGTAILTIAQKQTRNYTGDTVTFNVSVIKHEPEYFWNEGNKKYYYQSDIPNIFRSTNTTTDTTVISGNPYSSRVINNTLHIYNVEEPSTYTLRQAENYYWKFKEETVTVTPVEQNNHVPFTVISGNKDVFVVAAEEHSIWNGDNGYKMGDAKILMQNAPYSYIIIQFTGIPDELSFTATCDKIGVGLASSYPVGDNYYFDVYESADGTWGDTPTWSNPNRSKHYAEVGAQDYTVQLQSTTRYVKLCYHGTCYGHYRNIHISELNVFDADKDEINFGTQGEKYGTQVNTVNFSHANAGRTTTTTIEGVDAAFFTVTPDVIPETGRDISGMTTCRVTFNNNDDRRNTEYRAELVISDNLEHEERVTLRGRRFGKCAPEYTWNPNHLPYYFNATIAHVAVSTNTDYEHCPMSYLSTDDAIAYVDASGSLHIGEKSGTVTITVRQTAENNDYTAGSATFTFTARPRPNLSVPFQVNSSIYSSSIEAGNKCYWENDETGRVRAGNRNIIVDDLIWENDEKVFTLSFNGTPEKLSFEYRNNNMGIMINSTKPKEYHMWEVFESSDGVTWHSLWNEDVQHKEWTAINDLQLAETTQYIKFVFWGNYEGYWRNINVTSFDGYKFLREEEHDQYLSRGANWGTRAIVDAFGIATRVTRSTPDNVNYYAKFQFVDNEKYMFEDDNHEIYTDNWRNTTNWKVTIDHDLWKIQSANNLGTNDYYITITNGNLTLTNNSANATEWYLENYAQHTTNITKMLDEQAVAAASHSDLDFPNVTTLAGVRDELEQHGYEFTTIDLPANSATAQSWAGRSSATASPVYAAEMTDLVPGFYHLQVKAFMRVASANVAYSVFDRGIESVVAYAYANEVKYPINSIFDETGRRGVPFGAGEGTGRQYPDGYYYADDLTAADVAFANENGYQSDVYVYVPADAGKKTGTLRYGIMSPSYVEGAWMVYGDIVLRHLDRAQYIFEGTVIGDKENWKEDKNWDRDTQPKEDNTVIIRSDVTISGDTISIYGLTIEEGHQVTIGENAVLIIGDGSSKGTKGAKPGNLHVENGGKVILNGKGELNVNDFILDASLGGTDIMGIKQTANSGQVQRSNKLSIEKGAYFDLEFDPQGKISYGWYDFTVPFEVNIVGGISRVNSANDKVMVCGEDFLIMEDDEVGFASGGRGWRKIYDGVLQPGKLYTIGFDDEVIQNTFRFTWNGNGSLTNGSSYTTQYVESSDPSRSGWNALGNGMMQHGYISNEFKVQVYNHNSKVYEVIEDPKTFAVGTAFLMQIPKGVSSVSWTAAAPTNDRPLYVNKLERKEIEEFCITLSLEGVENTSDRIWISASDEATGQYVIGRDLLKMGEPTEAKVAQMWAKRENMNLCDAEMPLVGSEANCDLNIFAPQEGTYILELENGPEDATLYLTYNGKVIWDLTASPASLVLNKGIKEGLGLRIKSNNSSEVAEGVDETNADTQTLRKVLIDDTIYVVTPDGAMYDLTGKLVQ